MSAFLTGLWAFVKSAPALWALYKELKKIFEYAKSEVDSKKRINDLRNGLEFARKTKDTRGIERLFREIPNEK